MSRELCGEAPALPVKNYDFSPTCQLVQRGCWVGPELASGDGSPLGCEGDLGKSPKLCHSSSSPDGSGLLLPLGVCGLPWATPGRENGRVRGSGRG